MENNFTQKSMEAISEAHNFAIRYKHSDMKVEHLLLALIGQMNGLIPNLLKKMGIDTVDLMKKLEENWTGCRKSKAVSQIRGQMPK